jgi:foldase protein PrsA
MRAQLRAHPLLIRSLAAGLLLLSIGCQRKEAIPPEVIARVGDRRIVQEDFKHYLERNASAELAQIAPEAASALLDQYVEEALVSAYAASHGIDVSAERVAEAVRGDPGSTVLEKRDQMRRQRLVADIETRVGQPTEDEIRTYFEQHPDEFNVGERVRARQILVHDEALATEIQRQLQAGKSFEELSKQHSAAPNAEHGGDIGYLMRGQIPKVFEDELFNLQPGSVSRVIRTDSSFHLFRVDDRQPAGRLTLAAATPLIQARLKEEAMNREMTRIVRAARAEIPVSILTKRLPFEYSGALPRAEAE